MIPQQKRPNIRQLHNIKMFGVLKDLKIVESINLQKIDNSTYLEKPFHNQEGTEISLLFDNKTVMESI